MRKPIIVLLTVMVKMQLLWWEKMYYGNEPMQQNFKNSLKISLLKRKTSALSLKGCMTMRNRWTQGRNATVPYGPCTNTHKVAGSLLHPMQIIIKRYAKPRATNFCTLMPNILSITTTWISSHATSTKRRISVRLTRQSKTVVPLYLTCFMSYFWCLGYASGS